MVSFSFRNCATLFLISICTTSSFNISPLRRIGINKAQSQSCRSSQTFSSVSCFSTLTTSDITTSEEVQQNTQPNIPSLTQIRRSMDPDIFRGKQVREEKVARKVEREGVVVCSNDGDSTQCKSPYDMRRAFRRHAL